MRHVMERRKRAAALSLLASVIAPLAGGGLLAEADANQPVAKFKLLSMSGRQEVTYSEQDTDSSGDACIGTTQWGLSYRSTKPVKFYVFLRQIERRPATVLSTEPKTSKFSIVPVEGEATTFLRRDYSATTSCAGDAEAECPGTPTGGTTEVFVDGNFGIRAGSMGAGVSGGIPGVDFLCEFRPLPLNSSEVEFEDVAFATAISRRQLLGKQKRLEGTGRDEVPLVDTATGPFDDATASGTSTEEISVSLKRLKLKPKYK
jgi:hypothetical protein